MTYQGTVSITKDNDAYVRVPELDYQSIFVSSIHLATALQGDRVTVEVLGKQDDGQMFGKILSIESRGKHAHAGILKEEKGVYVLVPHDKKTYTNILVKKDAAMDAEPGMKVAVEIIEWQNAREMPWGRVVKVLGRPGENNAEMLAYALERGFSDEHKVEVAKEAHALQERGITETDIVGRRDFRNTLTFTIDPADAKDFDDAISFKNLGDGKYEVGIHIADVSYYVKPGTHLDEEAIERETSVYLVDRCIPMLPEELSNDLCSLVEGKDRLVMSAVFTIDDDCNIYEEWYGRSVINSAKRFTYENAQESMDSNGLHSEELHILNNIAKKMTKARFENGALSLDSEEVKFKLDENGKPVDVYIKVRGDTHKMIEELMLLANRKVSEFITKSQKLKKPICIYRIHDKPDAEKMHDLNLFIKALGYTVRFTDGVIPSQDLNDLLKKVEGRPEKDLLQTNITRSMQKAVYSTDNVGHYGLAFEYYSHFTSPIRRYPDVLTHRLLDRVLHSDMPQEEERSALEKLCLHASLREKEAADAERGSIKYKQVEYMSERVGQVFEGVVSGVAKWGIFVEEKKSKCEGMIRLRDLGNDFYVYDEKRQRVFGEREGKEWRIGDIVRIEVKQADLEMRQLDYKLID